MSAPRTFKPGCYAPLPTPFKSDQEVDYAALQRLVVYIAKTGMGITLLGTTGEASHLTDEERSSIVSHSRQALDAAGLHEVPIMVGTGTGSAYHTIKLCQQAKQAGADACIVISPSYTGQMLGKNYDLLKAHYLEILDKSPLPVFGYNFPQITAGIDMDSIFINELAEHKNLIGFKLTCQSMSKGLRVAAYTSTPEYLARHGPFLLLPGMADYLLPAMLSKASGCIVGTGNLTPKTIVKLYELSKAGLAGDAAKLQEAVKLQELVSEADFRLATIGIPGIKAVLDTLQPGLGGYVRTPLQPFTKEALDKVLNDPYVKKALDYEKAL